MKKVLITGANGFVGQHLVEALRGEYKIYGLSNSAYQPADPKIEYFQADITNKNAILEIFNKLIPDIVVHLAGIAQTHHIEPAMLFQVNFFGVFNILESVSQLKEKTGYNPKILHVSSSDVYGNTENPIKISEKSICNPVNLYGVSKLSGDRLAYQYSQSKKLRLVIFRPFPHTGPRQNLGFFVPDMVSQIVRVEKGQQEKIMVGNLEAVRDYSDVRDVVKAYKSAIDKEVEGGQVFNICSGNGIKIKEILEKILKLANIKIEVSTDPNRLRPSDLPILVGDNQKIKSKLGWNPTISFDQTIKDSLEYWRNLA